MEHVVEVRLAIEVEVLARPTGLERMGHLVQQLVDEVSEMGARRLVAQRMEDIEGNVSFSIRSATIEAT